MGLYVLPIRPLNYISNLVYGSIRCKYVSLYIDLYFMESNLHVPPLFQDVNLNQIQYNIILIKYHQKSKHDQSHRLHLVKHFAAFHKYCSNHYLCNVCSMKLHLSLLLLSLVFCNLLCLTKRK